MDPLVSVLMPCYNATATLGMALASLQAQTYQNWECILVDDGSTDSPDLIVEQFRDSRIRYTRLDSNKGRSYARGLSTSLAKGDLLAMVDADDWIYPDKLEKQVEVMTADPSVTVVGTGIGIIDSSHNLAGVRAQGPCPSILRDLEQSPGAPLGIRNLYVSPARCCWTNIQYAVPLGRRC